MAIASPVVENRAYATVTMDRDSTDSTSERAWVERGYEHGLTRMLSRTAERVIHRAGI